MKIQFKHHEDLLEYWPRVHPQLKEVFRWVATFLAEKKQIRLIRITAVYYRGGSGVHEKLRAVDFRLYRDGMQELYSLEYSGLEHLINNVWDYGDGRHPVALFHNAGTGQHMHIQVRDETRKLRLDIPPAPL